MVQDKKGREKMESLYISKKTFSCGEMVVTAVTSKGELVFGFRTRDYWGWQNQARAWTSPKYIPVFLAKGERLTSEANVEVQC